MRVAITGGATGIGAEVIAKLLDRGDEVIAFDISAPQNKAAHWINTDLSNQDSISGALAQIDGSFDALINNAGLPPRDGLEVAVLQVNFFGLVSLMNGMLDHLNEGASIVNTASRAGAHWRDNLEEVKALLALNPNDLPDFVQSRGIDPTRAYNLSKEALIVHTMTRTQEMVQRGLRMNSVSPAAVSTGILDDFAAAFGEKMTKNVARTGRPGHANEIADVILFLASPESAWIKGQDIVIDGGMSAMAAADMLGF